jgi:hypothetical protein
VADREQRKGIRIHSRTMNAIDPFIAREQGKGIRQWSGERCVFRFNKEKGT